MSARYYEAVGRRKTSSARVRLYPGTGTIVVNEKPAEEYFKRPTEILALERPLVVTDTRASYNVSILVAGVAQPGRPARFPTVLPGRCASPTKPSARC